MSKRWIGFILMGTWIVAVVVGGALESNGQHRASRFLAGSLVGLVGLILASDWGGTSRDLAARSAKWYADHRWFPATVWQRSERVQYGSARAFGVVAVAFGAVLVASGFAY